MDWINVSRETFWFLVWILYFYSIKYYHFMEVMERKL